MFDGPRGTERHEIVNKECSFYGELTNIIDVKVKDGCTYRYVMNTFEEELKFALNRFPIPFWWVPECTHVEFKVTLDTALKLKLGVGY